MALQVPHQVREDTHSNGRVHLSQDCANQLLLEINAGKVAAGIVAVARTRQRHLAVEAD